MALIQGDDLILEPQGRLLVHVDGAQVTYTEADGVTPLAIYADEAGTVPVTQPLTTRYGRVEPVEGGDWWHEPTIRVRHATHPDGRELAPLQQEAYSAVDSSRLTAAESAIPINAAAFSGVDRSGVADSAAALQTAIDAAAGRALLLPFGTYRFLASGLTVPAAGVTLILDDAELDFSDCPVATTLLNASGSLGAWVNCNAVAFRATAITGAAGIESGIAAGDLLKLHSADVYDPARTGGKHGEVVEVASTSSGTINLRSPVMGAYSTAVQFAKITPTRLDIHGTGKITGGGAGSQHQGIQAKFAKNLRIVGPKLEISYAELQGVSLTDCIDFVVAHLAVEHSNSSATGYGVNTTNACQFGLYHHCHFRDCRHSTSITNSSSTGDGIPRHITYDHCVGRDNLAGTDNFDTHATGEYITYDTCKSYDAGNVAFNIECNKARLINCESYGSGSHGVLLLPCASVPAEYEVRGCRIYDAGAYGLRVLGLAGAAAGSPVQCDVLDNEFVRSSFNAVLMDGSADGWRFAGARMRGNRAYNTNAGGGLGAFEINNADGSEVVNNVAVGLPAALPAVKVSDFTKGELHTNSGQWAVPPTGRCFNLLGVVDSNIHGLVVVNPGGVSDTGLYLDAASSGCKIGRNMLKGTFAPLNLNAVTSHDVAAAEGVLIYSTDADRTLLPKTDPPVVLHRATLTAARLMPVSTSGAYYGQRFRVARSGAGAFNLTVAGAKNLATNQWVEVTFDGSAWVVTAFGSL